MTAPQAHSPIRQAEIIMALSLATDLGTGRPMEWAMRSAMLGVRLGDALGVSEQDLRDIYYTALLVYVGCTSEVDIALRLFGDDPASALASVDLVDQSDPAAMSAWMGEHLGAGQPPAERQQTMENAGQLITQFKIGHCEVAQRLAEHLGLEASIPYALGHMYERWDGAGVPGQLQGEAIALATRIVLLVRDLEAHLNTYGIEAAVAVAGQRAGSTHDPRIVTRFCDLAPQLCAGLEEDATWEGLLAIEPGTRAFLSEDQLDSAMSTLADFIDLISPYFTHHSRSVAVLAGAAGEVYGLPGADRRMLRRAALGHDIGKVAVPHGLWNRSRPLSRSEWERVRLHPYYTERILSRPQGLAQLGSIAALHHERLDGSGYHRNVRGEAISPTAHLLAAANFYQARIEARPNRDALSPEQAIHQMKLEARAGRLDGDAVNAVLNAAGHPTTPRRREYVAGLSEREIEVLRLVTRGLTNRQMAEELHLAEKTVGNHIMHIYEKIGCSSRSAATLFAMQHHLVND